MHWLAALMCSLGLSSCAGGDPQPPVTVSDPMTFLVGTTDDRKQRIDDPIRIRRHDYGHYVSTDSFQLDDTRAITTWDYPPFGSYDLPSDGGEQYIIEGRTVRIEGTRDGGKPYNQYFVGANCGGTGWVLFRTDADETWRSLIAQLSIAPDPTQCSSGSQAFSRYTKMVVVFPILGDRETIISEHYGGSTMAADALERSFFVAGIGRVAWQAFNVSPGSLPPEELAARCPDFQWNSADGKYLVDCRVNVQTESAPGSFTGAAMWQLGE